MKAKSVYENIRFERGGLNSREDILDRVLDRKITIELEAHNVTTDDKGKVRKGLNEDNDYFLDVLEKSGVQWKQLPYIESWAGGVPFVFKGTKEQLMPVLAMWDAYGRSPEEVAEALKDWNGSEEDLWEIIG
jgi:hypothetical protein